MSNGARVKWNIEADYIQACNCDYGCPCEFSAPPTRGFCEGLGAWAISRGKYGEVPLDGLALAFVARWPKAIHEGNGTVCLFFDERANGSQRDALLQIASGQAGGLPFEILATTFSKILDPQYARFQFDLKGINSSVKIGDAVAIRLEPIKNPVTGQPEDVRVQHGTGFVFKDADCAAATECKSSVPGLTCSWPNKAGFFTRIQYSN
jgi:hypothetical protein